MKIRYITLGSLIGLSLYFVFKVYVILTNSDKLLPLILPLYPREIAYSEIRGLFADGPIVLIFIGAGALLGLLLYKIKS